MEFVSWDDDILQLNPSTCPANCQVMTSTGVAVAPWLSERALLLGVSHGGCWLTAVVIKLRRAVHLTCIWGTVLHHIIHLWRLSCNWLWVCPIAPCAAATLAAERYALGPGGVAWGSRWRWLDPQSLLVSWIGWSTSFYLLDLIDLLAELFGVFFFCTSGDTTWTFTWPFWPTLRCQHVLRERTADHSSLGWKR